MADETAAQEFDLHERVVLNVGGTLFETYVSTLQAFPDSLLGTMFSPRNRHLRRPDKHGHYFFDRDPAAFAVVLNYYRSGKLIAPPAMSHELLLEELAYFQVPTEDRGAALWTWGRGEYGQLGCGDRASSWAPRQVEGLGKLVISGVALGTSHSAVLTQDGQVYTFGYGGDGRLGHGDDRDVLFPRQVQALAGKDVCQVRGARCTALVTC